jgi:hypothetical protein
MPKKIVLIVLIHYGDKILNSYYSRDNVNLYSFTSKRSQQLSQEPVIGFCHLVFINCFSKNTTSKMFKLKETALKKNMY